MSTTSYTQRARAFMQSQPSPALDVGGREKRDNELMVHRTTTDSVLVAPVEEGEGLALGTLLDFAPLDRAIVTSTATRRPVEGNRARLAHAQQVTARPDVTPLHRQLVEDRRAILRERERQAAMQRMGRQSA